MPGLSAFRFGCDGNADSQQAFSLISMCRPLRLTLNFLPPALKKQAKHEVAGDYVLQKISNCKERMATSVVSLTQ
ncbi:MAG: hypothetical protein ACKVH7_05605 [Alphaproteobacteria bacterium]|jgi:hypothetical protein